MALSLIVVAFASCSDNNNNGETSTKPEGSDTPDTYTLRVATLKGPTGMGMAKLISDNNTSKKYTVDLYGDPTEISANLIKGNLDIAAVPVNLGAVINQKTGGKYVIAAINTLGVLHIVENGNTITDIKDLEGKTLYATGQGSTPEYMLNYILEKNGLKDKVNVVWQAEHAELATMVAAGTAKIAMLPEPHVTTTLTKNADVRTALDLTAEWDKVSDGSAVQGCIVVSKDALANHKGLIDAFLDEYKASVDFVNNNIPEASEMIAQLTIVPAAKVAEKAIPRCNIVFVDGEEMVKSLSAFYRVLYDANPQSIGGKLPDETLYYKR